MVVCRFIKSGQWLLQRQLHFIKKSYLCGYRRAICTPAPCFNEHLTLVEAQQQWRQDIINYLQQKFQRKLFGFENGNIKEVFSDFLVPTCRVLGTDRYIPFDHVDVCKTFRDRSSESYRFRLTNHVEKSSKLPVEVCWAEMSEKYNNTVTVEEVQALLPPDVASLYSTDLLRIYLLATEMNSYSTFYFSKDVFVNQLDGIKEWLDSLLQLVTHVASLKSTQNVPEQCELLRMRDTKLKILGCLDHSFKLPAALDWLQYLTNQIKKLSNNASIPPAYLYRATRDVCVMSSVMAPATATICWQWLHTDTCWAEYAGGDLIQQQWPPVSTDHDRWPFVFLYLDSTGQHLLHRRILRPASNLERLDNDMLKDMALGVQHFQKKFGDIEPEIESVTWHIDKVSTAVRVRVVIKTSTELTSRLAYLRSL